MRHNRRSRRAHPSRVGRYAIDIDMPSKKSLGAPIFPLPVSQSWRAARSFKIGRRGVNEFSCTAEVQIPPSSRCTGMLLAGVCRHLDHAAPQGVAQEVEAASGGVEAVAQHRPGEPRLVQHLLRRGPVGTSAGASSSPVGCLCLKYLPVSTLRRHTRPWSSSACVDEDALANGELKPPLRVRAAILDVLAAVDHHPTPKAGGWRSRGRHGSG